MEELLGFIFFVMLAAGILQIILLYKVWVMTNDIHELKVDHFSSAPASDSNNLTSLIRKSIVLDDKEKVKKILISNFIDQIESKCADYRSGMIIQTNPNMDMDITPYINLLIRQMAKIQMEVPESILKMKTYRDYYKLFRIEELRLEEEKRY